MIDETVDQVAEAGVQGDEQTSAQSTGVAETSPATTPGPTAPAPIAEGTQPTPEQIAEYRQYYENYHKWAKQNTEESQRLNEQARQFEMDRQRFYTDPMNKLIYDARQLMEKDPTLYAEAQRYVASGGKVPEGAPDPLVVQMAFQIRNQENQIRAIQFAEQQKAEAELNAQTLEHVETFRASHPDMDDTKFNAFMERYKTETDVTDLEQAYRILCWDELTAKEREKARAEFARVEEEKKAAASGIQPGAHEAEKWEGDPKDVGFRKTKERAMNMFPDEAYE